jgi:hypothetical protein
MNINHRTEDERDNRVKFSLWCRRGSFQHFDRGFIASKAKCLLQTTYTEVSGQLQAPGAFSTAHSVFGMHKV